MYSIILVDDDQDWRTIVSLHLRDNPEFSVVAQAGTGKEAIILIDYYRPSIILLDIVMPEYDGMKVIRYIDQLEDYNPSIYIITGYATDSIVKMLSDMDIVRYDLKPISVDQVVDNLKAIAKQSDDTAEDPNGTQAFGQLNHFIETTLLQIGIPANLLGFLYIKTAIRYYIANKDILNDVTKNLYPAIAEQFRVKASVVERNIRTAISACEKSVTKLFQDIFLVNPSQRITNKVFLILLAKHITSIYGREEPV